MAGIGLFGASYSAPFGLAITSGNVDGWSVIDKFGYNPLITAASDPEDIWEGGGTYIYDDFGTAPITSLASNSAADTQEILVQGLDIEGKLTLQKKTLQGTTRIALDTPLWRVFRMENEGTVNIAGTVFCYTGTGPVPSLGDPEVRAVIDDGNNQTQMALYTVPKNKVGFLFRGEIGLQFSGSVGAGTQFAQCQYKSRRIGKVFKVKKTITLLNASTSIYTDDRGFPDPIPALTDIKITGNIVSEDMGLWATLCIGLVDECLIPLEHRIAIGQPGA